MHLRCREKILDLRTPRLMGILNLTPDSFYDGGKHTTSDSYLRQTEMMLRHGADIIDIGGMSSRPGAEIISPEEELDRILPAMQQIRHRFPEAILSIDTLHARVAAATLQAGAHLINDISGGTHDPDMIATVAVHGAAFVLMHKKGLPAHMQQQPEYGDVVQEVKSFFSKQIEACRQTGLKDLVLDPGFGFGKTLEHNYALLRHFDAFRSLHLPLLAGLSRKSMVCQPLGISPGAALNGTTVLHTIALMNGANLLRVHDVKEAAEAIRLWLTYEQSA